MAKQRGILILQNVYPLVNQFDQVIILKSSLESAIAKRIQTIFPESKIVILESDPFTNNSGAMGALEFNQSKKRLMICPFPGQFFKRCPGATQKKTLTCCNYFVLNLGSQCNMNCTYCYLQSYLNSPVTKIYSNIEQAFVELAEMAKLHANLPYRVGTGEITDSLSLDPLSLYSRQLIEFFRSYPAWTLEFKTKSNLVDQFLDVPHVGNVTVSWSVNPQNVIESEEFGTASLEQRLTAAKKCLDKKFNLAFHIDPIIYHPDWKKNYSVLVDKITTEFLPHQVQVISLGTLRFQPEQRHLMKQRFPMTSMVNQAEMFQSASGKMRYDQNLRSEMLKFVLELFHKNSQDWKVFFCMETPETWISSYGAYPLSVQAGGGLGDYFRPLPQIN